jgi:hypothetical protein
MKFPSTADQYSTWFATADELYRKTFLQTMKRHYLLGQRGAYNVSTYVLLPDVKNLQGLESFSETPVDLLKNV